MCLIITGAANKVRSTLLQTPDLLKDIFTSNKDGIGSMYASDDGMVVVSKLVPKDLAEAQAFIEQLPESDRDIALHFRMRTHGDIDLTNCHPYPIVEGQVHMMHNGVIRGVSDVSDKTKSDTWHYINQVLKPQIEAAPALLAIPSWQRLVARDIGDSNRFVLLDKDGHMVTLNKADGVEHDGMWFSNEYAWRPEMLIPGYLGDYYSGWKGWATDDEVGYGAYAKKHTAVTTPARITTPAVAEDDVWEAVNNGDADAVFQFLDNWPISTMMVLFKHDRFVCSVAHTELSQQDAKIVQMVEAADEPKLAQYCRKSAARCRKVAEVVTWYGFWSSNVPEDKDDVPPATPDDPPDFDVIPGQVVPRKSPSGEADDEGYEGSDQEFEDWMARQQPSTGVFPTTTGIPAKWTAQTPALLTAQVAPIKRRTVHYRGYPIEVPLSLLEHGQWGALRHFLESEAQQLHDAELKAKAKAEPAEVVEEATAGGVTDYIDADGQAEASNEAYAG